jgi:insertion element IS1 protein InsB
MAELLCCKKCGCAEGVKNGHTRGMQRYRCKGCGANYTPSKRRGVDPALKAFAIVLYAFAGVSMGKIARLYKVSTVAVLKWVHAEGLATELPTAVAASDIVMIDEMWHFVNGKKNKVWLWRAVDGVSRAPLGWELGARSDAVAQKLIRRVDTGTCSFITDDWPGLARLLPEDRHFPGKDLTFPIEATHSDIRHRLARFVRKTKASSRSRQMVDLSLRLFHHLQNPRTLDAYLNPLISSFS